MTAEERTEFHGWKEIASHFQVSVRTAQLWEKGRGMPVHRLPAPEGQGPARVFAVREELDSWAAGVAPGAERDASESRTLHLPRRTWVPAAAGLVLVLAVAAWATAALESSLPSVHSARVVDDTLVALDEAGNEAWRYEFREGVNEDRYELKRLAPQVVDLDGDGQSEILVIEIVSARANTTELLCLSGSGELLWRFRPGARLTTGSEEFENIFKIGSFRVADLDATAPGLSIVVASHHFPYYPTQIALLSHTGELQGAYWHAGHLGNGVRGLAVADFNGDGHPEIFATGVNNARRRATLVVLDPRRMNGAGQETEAAYQFQGISPASELARIYFPRTAVNFASTDPFNVAMEVALVTDESVTVGVSEEPQIYPGGAVVHYRIGPRLELESVVETGAYTAALEELQRSGAPLHGPSASAELARGVEIERPTIADNR